MGPISPWCCPTPHCHGAWPVTACVNIVDPLPSATCAIVDHMAFGIAHHQKETRKKEPGGSAAGCWHDDG